jgi:LemA protein
VRRDVQGSILIAVAALVLLLLAAGVVYNGLIRRRNRVDSTWGDIDVLLRRRHDLVPNLVSALEGYAGHERTVLVTVAEARAAVESVQGPAARGEAEYALAGGVKSLIALAEAYPDLKASGAFLELQDRLTATEDSLAHARQFYNDAVYGYNTAIQSLPASLLAAALGFKPRQFFQAHGPEGAPPRVRA